MNCSDSVTCSKILRVSSGRPLIQTSGPTSARIRSSLLLEHRRDKLAGDRCGHLELGAVADPLPDLGAGDLGGGGVLHEVVDPRRAAAAEPERDVLEADAMFAAQAGLGDLARGRADVEQIVPR